MSAFIVPDELIHRLVVALKVERFFADHDRSLLGGTLIQMNEAAVNARYAENNQRNEPYVFEQPAAFSAVQAYKTIRCFLYQCSEGDVPAAWPLFAKVDEVRQFYAKLLGHDAANERWSDSRRAAEYRDAEWG